MFIDEKLSFYLNNFKKSVFNLKMEQNVLNKFLT